MFAWLFGRQELTPESIKAQKDKARKSAKQLKLAEQYLKAYHQEQINNAQVDVLLDTKRVVDAEAKGIRDAGREFVTKSLKSAENAGRKRILGTAKQLLKATEED